MGENQADVEQGVVLVSNGAPTDVTSKVIPAVDNPVYNLTISNLTYKVRSSHSTTLRYDLLEPHFPFKLAGYSTLSVAAFLSTTYTCDTALHRFSASVCLESAIV